MRNPGPASPTSPPSFVASRAGRAAGPSLRERAGVLGLTSLLVLLPFEPRRPTLALLGLEFTLLELAAAAGLAMMLWASWDRLPSLRSTPRPLAFLAAFVAANFVSAAFAPAHQGQALVYSLRMTAALVFAVLVVAAPGEAIRRSLTAITAGAALVAVLAVLEGAGLKWLDPFLDLFRTQPFPIGELRRASGGSENPNLAAAMLLYGLLASVAAAGRGHRRLGTSVPLLGLLAAGLVFTYSRGALVATGLGLIVLAATPGAPRRRITLSAFALGMLLLGTLAWLRAGPDARWHRPVEATGDDYAALYEPEQRFLSLEPGEKRPFRIKVTNPGTTAWSREAPLYLSYSWYDLERRVSLDRHYDPLPAGGIRPGQSLAREVVLQSPFDLGRYLLVWDVEGAGVGTFSSYGVEPGLVTVAVSRAPAAPFEVTLPPDAWRRGRVAMWRLALSMWGRHPLTGAGPDSYRWLHGAYGGWVTWSVLNRAHNAYLEVAATTGTLGLLTFLGTVAFTGAAGWRRLRHAPVGSDESVLAPALLALVVGIAAHGVTEACLPFTGHYLFLGFVVGAASALPGLTSTHR